MNKPVSCQAACKANLAEMLSLHAQPDVDGKALASAKAGFCPNPKRERAHTVYESPGFERHDYSYRMLRDPPPQGS